MVESKFLQLSSQLRLVVFEGSSTEPLLQTRTAVLNGELRDHFEEWYPELGTETNDDESEIPVKMAA